MKKHIAIALLLACTLLATTACRNQFDEMDEKLKSIDFGVKQESVDEINDAYHAAVDPMQRMSDLQKELDSLEDELTTMKETGHINTVRVKEINVRLLEIGTEIEALQKK